MERPETSGWAAFRQSLVTMGNTSTLFVLAAMALVIVFFVAMLIHDFPLLATGIGVFGVALISVYQHKRASRSHWSRYQEARALLARQYYAEAAERLEPLAEAHYPRAQYDLALLFARGLGIGRDLQSAVYWLQEAAERGHARAQHELATYYMDGRGVARDTAQGMLLLQKASLKLPEASMSLGYYWQHHPDKKQRDMAAAVNAYARAGQLYLKDGRRQDARAALKSLEAIAPELDATRNLQKQLSRTSRR